MNILNNYKLSKVNKINHSINNNPNSSRLNKTRLRTSQIQRNKEDRICGKVMVVEIASSCSMQPGDEPLVRHRKMFLTELMILPHNFRTNYMWCRQLLLSKSIRDTDILRVVFCCFHVHCDNKLFRLL